MSAIAVARAILLQALPDVKVASRVPSPIPPRFIRITRAGGNRYRALDEPRILVECFASTAKGAEDGVQAEKDAYTAFDALAYAANGGPWAGQWVSNWVGNTIADYPDPTQTAHARWQFTGTLYVLRN